MDQILTVNDVAGALKVKPITVREMFRTERIRGFKVGKAWRTTEKMLQEDIEKLSRGEAPEKLPKSNGAEKSGKKVKVAITTKSASPVENGKTAKKPTQTKVEKATENIEQLLF